MRHKRLFLRWFLINALAAATLVVVANFYADKLHSLEGPSKMLAFLVFGICAVSTLYCGSLMWRADPHIERLEQALPGPMDAQDRRNLTEPLYLIRSLANHVKYAAGACPTIGLIGSVSGMFFLMTGGLGNLQPDAAHMKAALANMQNGVGIAFVPTAIGMACLLLLGWEFHLLTNRIAYAIGKFERQRK